MYKIFFIIYLISFIQINWAINVCQNSCELIETKEVVGDDLLHGLRFYYGTENNEKCIIDPKRCHQVTKKSYFNTCRNCTVSKYVDNVFYGEENKKECVLDLNFCNLAFGTDYHYSDYKYCQFCYFHSFKNKTYYGFENGKECILNMVFCTQIMDLKENVKECKWCMPFEVKYNEVNKTVKFISKQEDGEECNINVYKCGLFNMNNYNGVDGNKNDCTYCHILEKRDNKYYSLENRLECRIKEDLCKNQIKKFEKILKGESSNGSLRTINININPLLTFILLICITTLLF